MAAGVEQAWQRFLDEEEAPEQAHTARWRHLRPRWV
jgi:hypothetical protein